MSYKHLINDMYDAETAKCQPNSAMPILHILS